MLGVLLRKKTADDVINEMELKKISIKELTSVRQWLENTSGLESKTYLL